MKKLTDCWRVDVLALLVCVALVLALPGKEESIYAELHDHRINKQTNKYHLASLSMLCSTARVLASTRAQERQQATSFSESHLVEWDQ